MIDTTKHQGQRRQLIGQLKVAGIKDQSVLNAIETLPRHWFMETGLEAYAYIDKAYPIAAEQSISQPYTVAFQTELLAINPGDKVLEIGTGSGYQTAVLLEYDITVYTLERQHELFKKTSLLFNKLKLRPKKVIFGDGYKGYSTAAPYDGIIVTAGAPIVPKPLLNQLSIGGRLVIPIGKKEQIMTRFIRKSEKEFDKEIFGSFRFVPLLKKKN